MSDATTKAIVVLIVKLTILCKGLFGDVASRVAVVGGRVVGSGVVGRGVFVVGGVAGEGDSFVVGGVRGMGVNVNVGVMVIVGDVAAVEVGDILYT